VSYTEGFKARMIERMTGPEGVSAYALSKDVGVSPPTLYRWIQAGSLNGMSKEPSRRRQTTWSASEKLRVVKEAGQLTDEDLGEFLRREGLHATQLSEWAEIANAAALASLTPPKRSKKKMTPEQRRIRDLEKELNRKDKALAEVTAILTLKKRVQEIWGDGEDDTDSESAK